MEAMAASTEPAGVLPALRAVAMTPVPIGFVRIKASPRLAPTLRQILLGLMTPVTA